MADLQFFDLAMDWYRVQLNQTPGTDGQAIANLLAPTPAIEIQCRNKMKVVYYLPSPDAIKDAAASEAPPILLIPSMINRSYILDLVSGYSLVEYLVNKGFAVYMIDWGVPKDEDQWISFDDLISPYLSGAVSSVLRHSNQAQVQIVGYCQGATLGAIYTAFEPDRVASFVNLLGPIDFRCDGLLAQWTRAERFDPQAVVDAYGNVPPALMQSAFHFMKPMTHVGRALRPSGPFSNRLQALQGESASAHHGEDHSLFFRALDYWSCDNVPFPGQAYVKYIRELYQQNAFLNDRLKIRGRTVSLSDIEASVLVLAADKDHIVPSPSALGMLGHIVHERKDGVMVNGGHVGSVVGPSARAELWSILSQWLATESIEKSAS